MPGSGGHAFWPVGEAAQADYEVLREQVLVGQPAASMSAARFARRGLAGLIAWPASEPVFTGPVLGGMMRFGIPKYRLPRDVLEAEIDRVLEVLPMLVACIGGGSNAIGALGYVVCAQELLMQANERQLRIDHVVHATGSCGTQAGLVVGLQGMNTGIPVLGIGVRAPRERQHAVRELRRERRTDSRRYQRADRAPYVYKTSDYGQTWTKIVDGIPATASK